MSEAKHSPLPWHVMVGTFGKIKDQRSATIYATGEELTYVARCDGSQLSFTGKIDSIADAEFIVRACNSHYDLLEACREMQRTLTSNTRQLSGVTRFELSPWLPMLATAIAKAEGK